MVTTRLALLGGLLLFAAAAPQARAQGVRRAAPADTSARSRAPSRRPEPPAVRLPPAEGVAGAETLSLRAGDMLRVRVWPDSTLGGDFPVEENGIVLLPVVGSVRATGRTLAELRLELRGRYEQAMKLPVVTILPVFRVSVLGAVMRPGLYQVDPTMTLFDVISEAGGFRPDARQDRVRVVREGSVLPIDAQQALRTGALPEALQLRSGDRIVVGAKRGGISGTFLLQAVTLLITVFNTMRY